MIVTISGDIISSTALSLDEKETLFKELHVLLDTLKLQYDKEGEAFFGRIIKGDYIECYLGNPVWGLRVMLIIKTFVKSRPVKKTESEDKSVSAQRRLFNQFGIRLAAGLGTMKSINLQTGILDGDAIYLSGRKIDETKSGTAIRNTLFFDSTDKALAAQFDTMVTLIDELINRCSPKQSETLYYKLLKMKEADIARQMGVSQSTVNQHSMAAGWNAIEKAVSYFEATLKSLVLNG